VRDEAIYLYGIEGYAMTHGDCWLAAFSEEPCDGRMQKAHLVRQQVIYRELRTKLTNGGTTVNGARETAWDNRAWRPACYRHHTMLDQSRTLRVPRSAIPEDTEQYAEGLGLGWWLDREYGPVEAAA